MTLKCGFLSTYHRHDDDCSITLYAHGSEWLIDGGMYNYDEKSELRKFLRSPLSHNLLVIPRVTITRYKSQSNRKAEVSDISDDDNLQVMACSQMYDGYETNRIIQFKTGNVSLFRRSDKPMDDVIYVGAPTRPLSPKP